MHRPSVFLSYRRSVSWQLAEAVQGDLGRRGFDVFMDAKDLGNGRFDAVILREIEARSQFVVILENGSLDRVAEVGDWLRREVAHALVHRRNVVPVVSGTVVPRAEELPPPMADLARITPVTVPSDYFREAMGRLEARLLGCTLEAPRLSLSPTGSGVGLVLRWTAVDGADEYVVHRDRDAQFDAAREVFRGPGTTAAVKGPRIGELWFRVRAESSGGTVGRWSRPRSAEITWGFGWR